MLRDLRYAYRMLRQNPGFALTAIVSIGLSVGANSAIISFQADFLCPHDGRCVRAKFRRCVPGRSENA